MENLVIVDVNGRCHKIITIMNDLSLIGIPQYFSESFLLEIENKIKNTKDLLEKQLLDSLYTVLQGNVNDSIQKFEAVLKVFPNNPIALHNLAVCIESNFTPYVGLDAKMTKKIEDAYILAINAGNSLSICHLMVFYLSQDDIEKAETFLVCNKDAERYINTPNGAVSVRDICKNFLVVYKMVENIYNYDYETILKELSMYLIQQLDFPLYLLTKIIGKRDERYNYDNNNGFPSVLPFNHVLNLIYCILVNKGYHEIYDNLIEYCESHEKDNCSEDAIKGTTARTNSKQLMMGEKYIEAAIKSGCFEFEHQYVSMLFKYEDYERIIEYWEKDISRSKDVDILCVFESYVRTGNLDDAERLIQSSLEILTTNLKNVTPKEKGFENLSNKRDKYCSVYGDFLYVYRNNPPKALFFYLSCNKIVPPNNQNVLLCKIALVTDDIIEILNEKFVELCNKDGINEIGESMSTEGKLAYYYSNIKNIHYLSLYEVSLKQSDPLTSLFLTEILVRPDNIILRNNAQIVNMRPDGTLIEFDIKLLLTTFFEELKDNGPMYKQFIQHQSNRSRLGVCVEQLFKLNQKVYNTEIVDLAIICEITEYADKELESYLCTAFNERLTVLRLVFNKISKTTLPLNREADNDSSNLKDLLDKIVHINILIDEKLNSLQVLTN